jgi:phosphatidylglycerophosphate synthase
MRKLPRGAAATFDAVFMGVVVASSFAQIGLRFVFVAASIFTIVSLAATIGLAAHPYDRFGAGNQVTTVRVALMAVAGGFVAEPALPAYAAAAVAIAGVATALDGIDGWLARRTGLASAFGARFDLEVDALLIMTLAVLAWRHGKAGIWILLAGLMRYLFLAAGALSDWMSRPLPPSRRRQTICVVQVIGLLLTLLPAITPPASAWIAAASLAALSYSFLVDIVWLWRARRDTYL